MSRPSDDPPSALHREYEGDLATLRSARRDVVEWLTRHGADDEAKDRAALIVSELTSNAIQAAPGSRYALQVARVDRRTAAISVRNHPRGGRPPARELWRAPSGLPPEKMATRGRGLAIVDSLSEEVTVEDDGDAVVVTARVRLDTTQ
jgi:anti-sigma regulatory factor (Ser/Thr protein kinase)